MTELKRLFVVGHPAAGKAYFSKYLAGKIGYHFIDADLGLEHRIGLRLEDILGESGLSDYERTQEDIFKALSKRTGIVVGLDCHLGQSPIILEHLKNACVVFLKTTVETQLRRCGSRHEPLIDEGDYDEVLKSLHVARDEFYHRVSNIVLHADDGDVDTHSDAVLDYLTQNEISLIQPLALTEKDLVFFKHNTDIPVRISVQLAICLKHLSKGLSAKEIAREMDISHRTVEVYIAQLKEKLECDSSKDLIRLYLLKH